MARAIVSHEHHNRFNYMHIRPACLATLLLFSSSSGQIPQPQSLSSKTFQAMMNVVGNAAESSPLPKCGTSLIASLLHRSLEKRAQFLQVLDRPARMDTSRLSPSGKFRIHYDTTGANQPALLSSGLRVPGTYEAYVDSTASILDHVWSVEIDSLGFDPPLSDGVQGGGPEYDVYILALGNGLFGYTYWDPADAVLDGFRQRYPTFMALDRDYNGYRTSGINALRVTAAHEFHHAIQVGAYGIWTNTPKDDFFFNELTSVWMEDVVYTDVNDYYFDVQDYFSTAAGRGFRDSQGQALAFTTYGGLYYGYERSIWAHFVTKQFGRDMMKEIWTGIRSAPFLQSADQAFRRHGSDFASAFSLFTYWNYFTGNRADTVAFYPEGKHYPRFSPNVATDYAGSTASVSSGAAELSSSFFEFRVGADTVTALVSNVDLAAGERYEQAARAFFIRLGQNTPAPVQEISNGLRIGFSGQNASNWPMVCIETANKTRMGMPLSEASPNPIHVSQDAALRLGVSEDLNTPADVFILSSSLDLVYSGQYVVSEFFGKRVIQLPSQDLQSHVSSGIHFVIARLPNSEYTWKVAVIR